METETNLPEYNFEAWQKEGYDKHSIVADPCMKNIENYDFTLLENSPAYELGFLQIDTSDIGPRAREY